jgi:cysteine desulfurase / selenocysteine lyase
VVVDGAQSAPHLDVSVRDLGCDFFAFSGHKLYGPTGIGGLWGRRELLEAMPPLFGGGDMIDEVQLERSTFAPIPHKFEAGTPHIAGAIGLAAAVEFVSEVGRDRIAAQERGLIEYAMARLAELGGVTIYGPVQPGERSGAVSFSLDGIHPHDLATILDSHGVAIRAGHHCTQPLMRHLGVAATARASFAMYNTIEEVDALLDGLHAARAIFGSGATA